MNTLKMINESTRYGHDGNIKEILNLGEINIFDYKTEDVIKVNAEDITDVVDEAMYDIRIKYPYLYLFINGCKVMYIPIFPSKICDSMCVDNFNNLWINMNFVYNECAMNKDRVFGILFHEMFHIFLDHILRFNVMFPNEVKSSMNTELLKTANKKANLAMDYEINASMVADGIVSEDFWKIMGGLYKSDYMGLTWEEIYKEYGDDEYREWIERKGKKINENEMKILEAIEKAAKVLKDPDSTDEDKAKANKELRKTIDKILGRDRDDDIEDVLEKIKEDTILGDIGEIGEKMQDVIDKLSKDPSKMSENQYNELMESIDEMAKEMAKNIPEIAKSCKKSEESTFKDIKKMRKTLKDSISQMKERKMSDDDKKDICDKIKDSLEDIISSAVAKEKNDKKRKERDEEKSKKRKETFKTLHPLRKLINVFKNLIHLGEVPYDLVCEESYDIMENIVNILEPLTEMKISEITKDDINDLKSYLSELKKSIFTDFKKLLDNKTILHKTESDLHKELDGIFEVVENALFVNLINPSLDDELKTSNLIMAAEKLRLIGKILKTQKAWRASDDFKEGYREKRDELFSLFKKDKKAALKELYDMGLIDSTVVMTLDKRSKALYDELVSEGKIK